MLNSGKSEHRIISNMVYPLRYNDLKNYLDISYNIMVRLWYKLSYNDMVTIQIITTTITTKKRGTT